MNVLHINTNFINTALHQVMIRHLDKKGIISTVFAPVCKEDIENIVITPDKNTIISECFYHYDRIVYQIKQKKILHGLLDSVKKIEQYEVIHAYTLFTDGNCAMKLSQKYGIPYVVAIRDTDVNAFFKHMIHLRTLGIKIMKNASAIFFLSKSYKKQVFDKYVPENLKSELETKTYIIPNGIDDFWIDNRLKEKKYYDPDVSTDIVFAGRINKRKNPLVTAEAISLLNRDGHNIRFNVVGKIEDNEIFHKLEQFSFVNYLGTQNKNELIETYRNNDIFVMPSLTETFGLAYAEAMSQGVPVVYSRGQGFDGQFPDGIVGEKCEATCAESVANAIKKIIFDYSRYSISCIDNCNRFNWNTICDSYISIYQRLIRN